MFVCYRVMCCYNNKWHSYYVRDVCRMFMKGHILDTLSLTWTVVNHFKKGVCVFSLSKTVLQNIYLDSIFFFVFFFFFLYLKVQDVLYVSYFVQGMTESNVCCLIMGTKSKNKVKLRS